ncbi:hypothetical protein PDK10_27185 [Bacillus cereus]|nr:hypothetical protein [Bacillus cereus]
MDAKNASSSLVTVRAAVIRERGAAPMAVFDVGNVVAHQNGT